MGFVYNNYWEALCRTYLELNGYFVMSNVFVNLFVPDVVGEQAKEGSEEKKESNRLEADLIAVKPSGANLKHFGILLDEPSSLPRNPIGSEFFAGIEDGEEKLFYCEVRAYLQSTADGFTGFFEDRLTQIKVSRIRDRFGRTPDVVLIGNRFSKGTHESAIETHKKKTKGDERWICLLKEMTDVLEFIASRFDAHKEKLGILYNDPCLEMMRAFYGKQPLAQLAFPKRNKSP